MGPRGEVIDARKWQIYLPVSVVLLLAPALAWFIRADSRDQRAYFDARYAELIHRLDLLGQSAASRDAALATWVESFRAAHPELKVPIYQPAR